jgi:hypothetical protein
MSEKPKDIVITRGPVTMRATMLPVTVWQSDNYAEDWYRDAVAEVRSSGDHNARRREIIFASCFAESFIFEWSRRKLQIEEIDDYFPPMPRFKNDPRYRRNLLYKWKEVPKELQEAGKLKLQPNLDLSRLGELLRYRHGLIHAFASRPATDTQPQRTTPFPRKKDLKTLKLGWAVSIVYDLVSELCDKLGEPKPEYLQKP